MMGRLEAGEFVTFSYNPPAKPKKARLGDPPEPARDPTKQVLVLHPRWQNMVHAIDLGNLTPAEVSVLRAIMDPKNKEAVSRGEWPLDGVPNYPIIRDILTRMDPSQLVLNPIAFYQSFVKIFLRGKDAYRKYLPQYISGVRVLEESHAKGTLINPRPLFHKT